MTKRELLEAKVKIKAELDKRRLSKACRNSFYIFIQQFWSVIIQEPLKLNWHIEYLADELQYLSKSIVAREPKPYDLIINIPPGTTKSTIVTIMFPAWLWTQDASLRIISNSYSETLSLEHAIKSRDIIQSEKYKWLFPEIQLRRDKSAKSFYANTGSGSRFATSTGSSVTGEHAHCLAGNTKVKTLKGNKKIKNIKPGDLVLSSENGILRYNKVVATKKSLSDERFYRVKVGRNNIRTTGKHKFFTYPGDYTNAEELRPGIQCSTYKRDLFPMWGEGGPQPNILQRMFFGIKGGILQSNLSDLWERVYKTFSRSKKGKEKRRVRDILLSRLRFIQRWASVRKVRENNRGEMQKCSFLQRMRLFRINKDTAGDMPYLRYNIQENKYTYAILLTSLCGQSTFDTNDRCRKFTSQSEPKLSRTYKTPPAFNIGKRFREMFLLRGKRTFSSSSYRCQPKKQQNRQFNNPMQLLPLKYTQQENRVAVRRVKELRRRKRYVYDIQVETANNFFANTILVHNCIISDDPLNPSQAASDVQRQSANEHTKTLATRKVDKENTPTVTIMQRLHDNDVTGYLLDKKGEKIKHICLPAEVSDRVSPPELKERYIYGLLDPVRLSASVLAEQKVDLGSRGYACQYAQTPSAEEGNIVKREWFKTIHPTDFNNLRKKEPIVFFADTAYKDKSNRDKSDQQQKNDPTGIISTCLIDNTLYITNAVRVFKKFPDLVKFIPEWVNANGYTNQSTIRIEPKASGISVVDQLKDITNLNVTYTPSPKDDKATRLNAVSPKIEAGRVVLVSGGWNEDFIDEICGFPARRHDEYPDLISYSIDYHLMQKPKPVNAADFLRSFR